MPRFYEYKGEKSKLRRQIYKYYGPNKRQHQKLEVGTGCHVENIKERSQRSPR